MPLVTEEEARIRSDGGTRGPVVLEPGEVLTPSARAYLAAHRVVLVRNTGRDHLPNGGTARKKPEEMTHLKAGVLVEKTHPRIRFRGMVDTLEGELLLAQLAAHKEGKETLTGQLGETLQFVRNLIRCDVLGEPLENWTLCGLTPDQLREHSHHPEKYYGQSHFLPRWEDGEAMLRVNRARTVARETELAGYEAFSGREENCPQQPDLMLGLNRLSSLLWILMIQLKAEEKKQM